MAPPSTSSFACPEANVRHLPSGTGSWLGLAQRCLLVDFPEIYISSIENAVFGILGLAGGSMLAALSGGRCVSRGVGGG